MPAVPKPERKASKPSRSAAQSAWLTRVSEAGCVVCRFLGEHWQRAEIHHPREGQGAGQRASDYLAIGLCPPHHRGVNGFHGLGKKGFYQRYLLDEMDLLALTIEGVITGQGAT